MALTALAERGRPLVDFCVCVYDTTIIIVRWLMWYMYTEQKKKRNNYISLNFEQTLIQSEIIAFYTSALDIRLPNAITDFHFDEYLQSYSMPTMGMLKVENHTVRMREH